MLLLVCVMVTTTMFAQAQQHKPCKPKGGHSKHMAQQLQLTETQREQMKLIHENGSTQRTAIVTNEQLSASEKESKLKAFKEEQSRKIDAILTPEQRAKAKALRQQQKHRGSKHHAGAAPVVR